MRCPKCNAALPIGGKVCRKCNYNVYTQKMETSQTQPAPPQHIPPKPVQTPVPLQPATEKKPSKPASKPKSKAGKWVLTILLALLATGIGRYVGGLAGRSMAENWGKDSESGYSYQDKAEETVNPAFEEFLADRGVSFSPDITAMNSECFAAELEDGMLEILEFGYKGDVVKEQIDTLFYPISGYSDADIALMESNARELFDAMADNSYTTVKYDRIEGMYIVIQLHFTDMDNQSTIQAMTDLGMIQKDASSGKNVDFVSIERTTAALLENGYIQR